MSTRTCHLESCLNPEIKITLEHGVPITVGRSRTTLVEDTFVSREQIEVTANLENCQVKVYTMGMAISGCNGYALAKKSAYRLFHGDNVELRLGYHAFRVVFDPPPEKDTDDTEIKQEAKRAKLDLPMDNQNDNNVDTWEERKADGVLIYTAANVKNSSKISAFDMDGTLIKTKSGLRFPKTYEDWTLNFGNVTSKLKKLYDGNRKVVIFTNQRGLGTHPSEIKDFRNKIENVVKCIGVPIQVFITTRKNYCRKPLPGMWDLLRDEKNGNIAIDENDSFFVGDAAGRDKNWAPKAKKDHSMADRLFALNVGVKFYTPEEFFLGYTAPKFLSPVFDPKSLTLSSNFSVDIPDDLEVVMMVGGPASGKSSVCKRHFLPKGYTHVNRDKLGSWQKCVKSLEESMHAKRSVVIDNTNPNKETRRKYLDVIKKHNWKCRCFLMTTTLEHAKHNNKFRELTDKEHVPINDMILHSYKKQFEPPDLSEGFSDIVQVPFVPSFESGDKEKLYKMFLLEK